MILISIGVNSLMVKHHQAVIYMHIDNRPESKPDRSHSQPELEDVALGRFNRPVPNVSINV